MSGPVAEVVSVVNPGYQPKSVRMTLGERVRMMQEKLDMSEEMVKDLLSVAGRPRCSFHRYFCPRIAR